MLQSVVDAWGTPPHGWAWEPPVELDTVWAPAGNPTSGKHEIFWEGKLGRYVIARHAYGIVILRGYKPVINAIGNTIDIRSVDEAKRYCEIEDCKSIR
jgi:hypothetical protein